MKIQVVAQGTYDADWDLTPLSVGHDIRLRDCVLDLRGAESIAFCPCDSPETIIYAEGATKELACLLGNHGFKIREPS